MGLRDWFRKSTPSEEKPVRAGEDVVDDSEAFARLQATLTSEANALFEEPDVVAKDEPHRTAPYDAGDAEVETLLEEGPGDAFTHIDEVAIEDVASLEDPLAHAFIEGDVPQTVVFEGAENGNVVGSPQPKD